jgi:hypothetical protein
VVIILSLSYISGVILDVVRTNTLSLLAIEIEPIRIDLIVAIVGVVSISWSVEGIKK